MPGNEIYRETELSKRVTRFIKLNEVVTVPRHSKLTVRSLFRALEFASGASLVQLGCYYCSDNKKEPEIRTPVTRIPFVSAGILQCIRSFFIESVGSSGLEPLQQLKAMNRAECSFDLHSAESTQHGSRSPFSGGHLAYSVIQKQILKRSIK